MLDSFLMNIYSFIFSIPVDKSDDEVANTYSTFHQLTHFDLCPSDIKPNSIFFYETGSFVEVTSLFLFFFSMLWLILNAAFLKKMQLTSEYHRASLKSNLEFQVIFCFILLASVCLEIYITSKKDTPWFFFEYWSASFLTDNYVLLAQAFLFFCSIFFFFFSSLDLYRPTKLEVSAEQPFFMGTCIIFISFLFSAFDLISVFICLEGITFASYILAVSQSRSHRSIEAAVKYFCIGSLSSGLLLYGMSLVYGITGFTNFYSIAWVLTKGQDHAIQFNLLTFPLFLIICGLFFKISAAPFHIWSPDVYDGVSWDITAFFSILIKTSMFIFIYRFLIIFCATKYSTFSWLFFIISILSLIFGCFGALLQKRIRRFIAYSSINQVGFLLLGLLSFKDQDSFCYISLEGISISLFHLLLYSLMSFTLFFILLHINKDYKGAGLEFLSDLCGFSKRSPFAAICLTIVLFSMAGVPPLSGFFGKYLLLVYTFSMGYPLLAIFALFINVICTFYYIRIIKDIWFDTEIDLSVLAFVNKNIYVKKVLLVLIIMLVFTSIFSTSLLYFCQKLVSNIWISSLWGSY